jgi:hypothetical protein
MEVKIRYVYANISRAESKESLKVHKSVNLRENACHAAFVVIATSTWRALPVSARIAAPKYNKLD